jgi:Holliday junction resolvase-like predicted endonuclease
MLTENEVITYLKKELENQGYENIKTVSTYQKGYDIVAEKDGKKLFIEAKGQTSSKQSNREGKEFTHSQKKTHVAMAVYKTMQTLKKEKDCQVGIALPKDKGHEGIIKRILPSLKKLDITVFWVDEGGNVDVK